MPNNPLTSLRCRIFSSLWPLLALLLLSGPLSAEATDPAKLLGLPAGEQAPADVVKAEAKPQVPEGLRSPRATMATFLEAMKGVKQEEEGQLEIAIGTLDLEHLNPMIQKERGTDLSWMLLEVLDRTRLVRMEYLPDWKEGEPFVFEEYPQGALTIARKADGRWLFSQDSLKRLPEIHRGLADKPVAYGIDQDLSKMPLHLKLRRAIPEPWRAQTFLLENWQWLGLLVIVGLGLLLDKFFSLALALAMRQWKSRTGNAQFKSLDDGMLRPWGLMIMAFVWWLGINLMGLPEDALLVLLVAVKFLAAFSSVWAAYRLVDLLAAHLMAYAGRTRSKLDDVLYPLIPKTLKVFITVVGIVFIADNMNIDVTGLLAGLGLAGMAFALAAKDMVQNLFGSVTVLLDRTFSVGDWIIIDGVEGTVEAIGFRSTRIRTFYNSKVTVPNSKFITASVDNMGERHYRRYSAQLGLTYQTPPDRIEAFCEGIRELVRQHPYMRKDYYHVYFNGYGASSLDILVYVFWSVPNWGTELRERHRFLLDILRLAQRIGVDFAYPTQTLFMAQPSDPASSLEQLDQAAAFTQGQQQARELVDSTLGLGKRPPPAAF
ncbi:MAG: mechanosensitive ion channel family protein [Gammaproteobacteria bacterium SHHR-1]